MTFDGVEPPAMIRRAATDVRNWFVALCKEGFTEKQAMQIIGYIFQANRPEPKDGEK